MKTMILAVFAILSLGVAAANAAPATDSHAPVQQENQFSSSEGGWG